MGCRPSYRRNTRQPASQPPIRWGRSASPAALRAPAEESHTAHEPRKMIIDEMPWMGSASDTAAWRARRGVGARGRALLVLLCSASVAAAAGASPSAASALSGRVSHARSARASGSIHAPAGVAHLSAGTQQASGTLARHHRRQQQLDEEGDGDAGTGVKTASKRARLDPANFLVVIIAAVILIYCCYRAVHPPFLDVEKMSTREREEMRELEEAGEMELHSTFLFVVVASVALVLIFYFMSAMAVLITILFSFIATISLGASLYPYVDHWTGRRFAHETDVPLLGKSDCGHREKCLAMRCR